MGVGGSIGYHPKTLIYCDPSPGPAGTTFRSREDALFRTGFPLDAARQRFRRSDRGGFGLLGASGGIDSGAGKAREAGRALLVAGPSAAGNFANFSRRSRD